MDRGAVEQPPDVGAARPLDPVVQALLAGDEAAFARLVRAWSSSMLHVARGHVSTDASAQEVVQETWLAVVQGLPRFEGRSALRTWVFRILVNTARARGVRDHRVVPVEDLGEPQPTVDPDRFRGAGQEWQRHWTANDAPQPWAGDPVREALRGEVRLLLDAALAALPVRQRAVVVLRDVEGLSPQEVCAVLDLTAANQRVLLHRGRAKVRAALEAYYRGAGGEVT